MATETFSASSVVFVDAGENNAGQLDVPAFNSSLGALTEVDLTYGAQILKRSISPSANRQAPP